VLDRDGEPVVLAAASRHKPDEAHELARIRSKVCDQAVSIPRDFMIGACTRLLTKPGQASDGDAYNASFMGMPKPLLGRWRAVIDAGGLRCCYSRQAV